MLVLVMVLGVALPGFAATSNFDAAVQKMVEFKVMEGFPGGELKPEADITRAQFATMIIRALGMEAQAQLLKGQTQFTDVPATHWASGYINLAVAKGIIKGTTPTTFAPGANVTYVQATAMILRAMGFEIVEGPIWWLNYAMKGAELGISGFVANPSAAAPRGGVAQLLFNALEVPFVGGSSFLAILNPAALIPANLEVVSLTQVNSKQIKVVFNQEVNATSAETIGNYFTVNTAGTASALTAPNVAELQADKRTVIITLDVPLLNNGAHAFRVANVINNNVQTVRTFTTTFIARDVVAPLLEAVSARARNATNTITLQFNEPVDIGSAAVTVNGQFAAITHEAGSNQTKVTVTSGTTLLAGATATLSIINFRDFAGNFTAINPLPSNVTVIPDTTAPTVTNIVVNGDNQLEITFDKPMSITTLTAGTNVRMLDANLNPTAGTLGAATVRTGTNNTVFRFPITGTTFPATNVMNAIVALSNAVTDLSGNALVAQTRNVSFTRDTSRPAVVSAEYKNTATYGVVAGVPFATPNGSIVFTFNEPITAGAVPATVITDLGSVVVNPFAAPQVNTLNTRELILPLNAPVATGTISYLILLPQGMVNDRAQVPNASLSQNFTVNVQAGGVVVGDTTAPVIQPPAVAVGKTLDAPTAININYVETGSGLDLTTVVNINNYRLDGLPLPAGSFVTVTSPTVTTVIIPAGSITADKTYTLTVSGIRDRAGNVAITHVANLVLQADAKPELNSAVINANGTVSIGFNLAVKPVIATTSGNDFVVRVNGAILTFAAAAPIATGTATGIATQYTLTSGVGADAGRFVITAFDVNGFVVNLNNAFTLSVATVASPAVVEANTTLGATLKGSTTIVVR